MKLSEIIIKEKMINWPLAFVMLFVNYLLMILIIWVIGLIFKFDPINNATKILFFAISLIDTYKGLIKIEPLTEAKLLAAGEETDIWLGPGYYFLFRVIFIRIWSVFVKETQSKEKDELIVPQFPFQDKKGKKLFGKGNATFAPGDSDEEKENYKSMKGEDLPANLINLLRQTSVRVLGGKNYWTEILGKELHDFILNDAKFKAECFKYGCIIKTFNLEVVSANLEQDDLNAYRVQLTGELKTLYPELKDSAIARMVDAQLKISKRIDILGDAHPVVRTDADS